MGANINIFFENLFMRKSEWLDRYLTEQFITHREELRQTRLLDNAQPVLFVHK